MCYPTMGFLVRHPSFSRPSDPDHPPTQPLVTTPIVFEPAAPAKFEYRVLSIDLREEAPLEDERLSALGAEGWILTSILTLPVRDNPAARLLYHFLRSA